jgi:hypothetical protein
LIASTHPGFASASQSFNVVIGAHDFIIDPPTETVNTTIGSKISYNFPLTSIQLDGKVIDRTNISSVTADLGSDGSWLTFDNTSLLLSGQPAKGDQGTTVTLTIQDVFEDIVQSTIVVDLFDGLFATTFPSTVNATIGQEFHFVLNDALFTASDVQIAVSFAAKDGANWLSYNSSSRTISGTPEASKAKSVQVDIDASSPSLSKKQTISFTVQMVSSAGSPVAPTTSSFLSSSNKSLIISLSVCLPVVTICTFSALVCCFRRRRKSSKSPIRAGSPIPPISRPYNPTPDEDWALEDEEAWGEPHQLGGSGFLKRGVSGMYTLKTSEAGTTGATVGGHDRVHENEKVLTTPMTGGPQEPPKTARGSWRRSEGRDWASVARSSDATVATVSTNEIFSVRLVQSPNPNTGGLSPISSAAGRVSPLFGGMGIRGATPVVTVPPLPEDNREYGDRSRDTIGTFSEGHSEVDYEGHRWELAEQMFPKSSRRPGLGHERVDRTPADSIEPFQSEDRRPGGYNENGRKTWHQRQESSADTIDDAVEYRVSRVSGPLSPINQNVSWDSSNGNNLPVRPRLVEFTKEKRPESASSSRHRSGGIVFV